MRDTMPDTPRKPAGKASADQLFPVGQLEKYEPLAPWRTTNPWRDLLGGALGMGGNVSIMPELAWGRIGDVVS